MLLGVYNYTVVLTYAGMLTAYFGIALALNGNVHHALICLMIAGVCDMFDGRIASTRVRTAQEKRFGIQIDSLSDLICFGVLPAVIVYQAAEGSRLSLAASGSYVLCALIRLAWFNVDEEARQDGTDSAREAYRGLPVTASALILPAALWLSRSLGRRASAGIAAATLALMGAAFLIPFRVRKPALPAKLAILLCGVVELILILLAGADL